MGTVLGASAFVVMLLFAIFFHELGHYLTARWAQIKVSRFFIGFGPTVWSFRRGSPESHRHVDRDGTVRTIVRPETEYGIKALPLGGFVKVVGMSPFEEVSVEDEPRAFQSAPTWKRAIVLAAGSATHFVTAFFVLFLIFAVVGIPDFDRPTLTVSAIVKEIDRGVAGPAARAGVEPGDRIVAVDGRRVTAWDEVRDAIRSHAGRELALTVDRDGARRTLRMVPVPETQRGKRVGVIGVYPEGALVRANPLVAIGRSGAEMKKLLASFFTVAPKAFSPQTLGLTGHGPSNERPFSILGAGRIAADLASNGQIALFLFLFVQINIFIAVFNMLPLPPLDGGHLLVLGIEKLRKGKPVDQRHLLPVIAVVFSVLMLLAVLLVYYDIVSPVRIPVP